MIAHCHSVIHATRASFNPKYTLPEFSGLRRESIKLLVSIYERKREDGKE